MYKDFDVSVCEVRDISSFPLAISVIELELLQLLLGLLGRSVVSVLASGLLLSEF